MRVGVIGASGYSGGELLRYLQGHPHFQLSYIAAGSNAGAAVTSVHPQLLHLAGERFEATDPSRANEMDLVFLAMPHGESAAFVSKLRDGLKIVDLGADFRLSDSAAWERYYGGSHAGKWIYGLPELPGRRAEIAHSDRVANPGCYATSIILGAAPFVSRALIDSDDITVVAASGTTGAGRAAKVNLLASEVMGSLSSYKFGGAHQHTPEVEESLRLLAPQAKARISFTPILAPMPRGILTTITAKTTASDISVMREAFHEFYGEAMYLHLLDDGMPRTSAVVGSNYVQITIAIDQHTSRWVASVAIDNLGKGAAGQALQNANLMAGFEESTGLTSVGIGA